MRTNKTIRTLLFIIFFITNGLYAQFAGGTGTQADPFQICTPEHLNNVRNYLGSNNSDKCFIMRNNIDLTAYLAAGGAGYAAWGEAGWLPIGNYNPNNTDNEFRGKFDGNHFKVTGLKIQRSTVESIGLFSHTGYLATITNLGIEGDVTGNYNVGGLVGYNSGANLENCYFIGTIRGNSVLGGLVGFGFGNLNKCYTDGNVISSKTTGQSYTGGLFGYSCGGTITGCYSTSSVRGHDLVGGLVGLNDGTDIIQSCATGNITGTGDDVGGLIGDSYEPNSYISNCYAIGSVSGKNRVGGLIGGNSCEVYNSYAVGLVAGTGTLVGGLIGCASLGTSVSNSFWDKERSNQSSSAGSAASCGKTTAEMKNQSTYTDWDFNSVWSISDAANDGYPILTGTLVSIETVIKPGANILFQNYPNPFNPETTINFSLINASTVALAVFNNKGELVQQLVNSSLSAGLHSIKFNAAGLNSGVYFYRLSANGINQTQKMLLVK